MPFARFEVEQQGAEQWDAVIEAGFPVCRMEHQRHKTLAQSLAGMLDAYCRLNSVELVQIMPSVISELTTLLPPPLEVSSFASSEVDLSAIATNSALSDPDIAAGVNAGLSGVVPTFSPRRGRPPKVR